MPPSANASWTGGNNKTTSPSRLSPPVVSEYLSTVTHASPDHASTVRGGVWGWMPIPAGLVVVSLKRSALPPRLPAKPR